MNIYTDESVKRHLENYLNTTEESESRAEAFRAGWAACLLEQQRAKALKDARKEKKIIIGDFTVSDTPYKWKTGFYCDGGFKIATSGHWLIKIKEDYPEEWEHKVISPDSEKEIDVQFPNYNRVIPDLSDMIPDTSLTIEGLRVIRSVTTAKALQNLEKVSVMINGEWIINLDVADRLLKAWEAMPDAVLYRNKEDQTKPFMLVSGDNLFVFMPSVKIYGNFFYESATKTIVKAA